MIEEIKHLVQLLGKVEIKHSSMDQNRVAHELAQLGSRAVSKSSWVRFCPTSITFLFVPHSFHFMIPFTFMILIPCHPYL